MRVQFNDKVKQAINEAAERAAGFYYEKTKDDFRQVMEAFDTVSKQMKRMVAKDEFSELHSRVRTIELVVKDTNKDLKTVTSRLARQGHRITRLEDDGL